jgi:hypothetical protein
MLLVALAGAPAFAQRAAIEDVEYQGEAHSADEREDHAAGRARTWSLAPWLPANFQSNRAATERDPQPGVALEPELSLGRSWSRGKVSLLAEVGGFIATSLPDAALDSGGWWVTLEAQAGASAEALAPYARYEPLTIHDRAFGRRLLTFHSMEVGVRRRWGPTAVQGAILRRAATLDGLDRWSLAGRINHLVPVGASRLDLRADVRGSRYDAAGGDRRRDLFARARARLFVPLGTEVDVALTADLQRNWSNRAGFGHTVLILGPALSASFSF